MLLSNCAVFNTGKSRFIKEQEAIALLSRAEVRTPLGKVPLVGPVLLF